MKKTKKMKKTNPWTQAYEQGGALQFCEMRRAASASARLYMSAGINIPAPLLLGNRASTPNVATGVVPQLDVSNTIGYDLPGAVQAGGAAGPRYTQQGVAALYGPAASGPLLAPPVAAPWEASVWLDPFATYYSQVPSAAMATTATSQTGAAGSDVYFDDLAGSPNEDIEWAGEGVPAFGLTTPGVWRLDWNATLSNGAGAGCQLGVGQRYTLDNVYATADRYEGFQIPPSSCSGSGASTFIAGTSFAVSLGPGFQYGVPFVSLQCSNASANAAVLSNDAGVSIEPSTCGSLSMNLVVPFASWFISEIYFELGLAGLAALPVKERHAGILRKYRELAGRMRARSDARAPAAKRG